MQTDYRLHGPFVLVVLTRKCLALFVCYVPLESKEIDQPDCQRTAGSILPENEQLGFEIMCLSIIDACPAWRVSHHYRFNRSLMCGASAAACNPAARPFVNRIDVIPPPPQATPSYIVPGLFRPKWDEARGTST